MKVRTPAKLSDVSSVVSSWTGKNYALLQLGNNPETTVFAVVVG